MSATIPPIELTEDTPVPVTLLVREWNQVLGYLSEQPFKVIAPLIGKIHGQAMRYGRPPPPNGPDVETAAEGKADGLAH